MLALLRSHSMLSKNPAKWHAKTQYKRKPFNFFLLLGALSSTRGPPKRLHQVGGRVAADVTAVRNRAADVFTERRLYLGLSVM